VQTLGSLVCGGFVMVELIGGLLVLIWVCVLFCFYPCLYVIVIVVWFVIVIVAMYEPHGVPM
jgi:hypothetical protein